MEKFLPILLGLLWLAVSIINRSKKKKQKNMISTFQEKVRENKRSNFFEEIFTTTNSEIPVSENDFEDEPDSPIRYQPLSENKIDSDYQPKVWDSLTREGVRAIDDKNINVELVSFSTNIKKFRVDLKKAFIYDAVFNPPYIEKYF